MAQPTNEYDSYDQIGIREDLANAIYNISPTDTPIQNSIQTASAANVLHEWQTDTFRTAVSTNAAIEGDATTASARTATTRLGNRTQIVKDSVLVSGTDRALKKGGRGSDMTYQMMKVAKELKRDLEMSLTANLAAVTGSNAAARVMAGIPVWLTSNTSFGAGGANGNGLGTTARTDGTQRAFTETLLKSILSTTWNSGGEPDRVYMTSQNQDIASAFVGRANAIDQISKGTVDFSVQFYGTAYGKVQFVPTRFMRTRDVLGLQSDLWALAILRDWTRSDLPADGDFEKQQLLTEVTLESRNQAGSFIIADLN